MRFEKASLKEKFDGLIFEKPKVKIKTVTQRGVIHLDFTNKMRVYRAPPKKRRRSLAKDLTIYQEQQNDIIDVQIKKGDSGDFVPSEEFSWLLKDY